MCQPHKIQRERGKSSGQEVAHVEAPVSIPWRSPRKRLFQEDKYSRFLEEDTIHEGRESEMEVLRFSCGTHKDQIQNHVNQTAMNIFFNSLRKITTTFV